MPYHRVFDRNGRETKNSGPRIQMGQLFDRTGPAGKKQIIRSNVPNLPADNAFLGVPGAGGRSNTFGDMMRIASALKGRGGAKPGATGTVDQYGGTGDNFAVNAPTLATTTPIAEQKAKTMGDYWGKEMWKGMPRDRFVTLMGMIGGAFGGQETAGGRLGTSLAGLAGGAMQRREAEARQIRKEGRQTPSAWEAFYKENQGTMTTGEMIEKFKKLGQLEKDPNYVRDIREDPEKPGSFQDIWRKKGTSEFEVIGPASPAQIEKWKAEPDTKVGKTIDISVNGRRVPMEATPELLADIEAGRKKVFEKPPKPEKEGWYTANVGGNPMRKKQTTANTEKWPVWKEGATKKDADVYKVATELNKLQFDNKGKWKYADVEGPVDIMRDKLRGTNYEVIETKDPAEKQYGWFGLDILAEDLPEGSSYYVIRKKVPGETRGGGEYRGKVPPTPEEAQVELNRREEERRRGAEGR